ncbi:MAG: hypothetical protein KF817_01235 [Phycisphaeraceae bacterium]|nr:hypothetical protein [Phycisphaeraceae bacterium]
MPQDGSIIVTAFEPSGDNHAAPVIAALRARAPSLRIVGWGGPAMAAAGAEIVGETVSGGAMGFQALARVRVVRRARRELARWLSREPVRLHLAVDSPAANFPLARVSRRAGARVVHLVAPQLWAWGPWRAARLRRTTDLVLCLLPFEEAWFSARRIPARFIGHPRMAREPVRAFSDPVARALPGGHPRLGLFPGSRVQEVRANLPLMLDVVARLRRSPRDPAVIIAAASPRLAAMIGEIRGARDAHRDPAMCVVVGESDAVAAWSDAALTVSGTMSLDLARIGTPMVGIYRTSAFSLLLSRLLLRVPDRLLPNLIAGARVVPEHVPCTWPAERIACEVDRLLDDPAARDAQRADLAAVAAMYRGHVPDAEAAEAILTLLAAQVAGTPATRPAPG